MLRYKEWKQLNESFLGPVTLGLGNVQNLGITGSQFSVEDLEAIEEAAKKGKKKMFGGGDEDGIEKKLAGLKKKVKGDKDELEGDEDELEGDEDEKDHKEPEGDEDELEGDDDGDKDDLGGGAKKKVVDLGGDGPMFAKKGGKGKKGCKKSGKGKCEETMTDEDKAWWASLSHQLSANPNKKYSDGTEYFLQKEDAVIPPSNTNAELVNDDPAPGPGDIGFSPQQRFGVGSEGEEVVARNPAGTWAGFSPIESVEQGIRSEE